MSSDPFVEVDYCEAVWPIESVRLSQGSLIELTLQAGMCYFIQCHNRLYSVNGGTAKPLIT